MPVGAARSTVRRVVAMTSAALDRDGAGSRISNLDLLRGVAVLGILVMNAVSYSLTDAAYFNLDAGGSERSADWLVGVLGEVFVDKFSTIGLSL